MGSLRAKITREVISFNSNCCWQPTNYCIPQVILMNSDLVVEIDSRMCNLKEGAKIIH